MKHLFLDIETIPAGEKPTPEEVSVPGTYKDPVKIAEYQKANVETEYRKRAVITYESRIICIAWAIDNEPVQALSIDPLHPNQDLAEHNLVYGFISRIYGTEELRKDLHATEIIGHNIMFDIKTIVQRCFKYNINCSALSALHAYHPRIKDTMRMFTLGDRTDLVSLSKVLKFFGIEDKMMKGSEVYDEYLKGNLLKIIQYCKEDVEKERLVYNKMVGEEIVDV